MEDVSQRKGTVLLAKYDLHVFRAQSKKIIQHKSRDRKWDSGLGFVRMRPKPRGRDRLAKLLDYYGFYIFGQTV